MKSKEKFLIIALMGPIIIATGIVVFWIGVFGWPNRAASYVSYLGIGVIILGIVFSLVGAVLVVGALIRFFGKMFRGKGIEFCCAYCRHGSQMNDYKVACLKRGIVSPHGQCRKFVHDPLKRGLECPATFQLSYRE